MVDLTGLQRNKLLQPPEDVPVVLSHEAKGYGGYHYCGLYSSDEEYRDMVGTFFAEGVSANEKILYCYADKTRQEVVAALKTYGLDVVQLESISQIEIGDAVEFFRSSGDGGFEPKVLMESLNRRKAQVAKLGFSSIRVAVETSWCLQCPIPGSLSSTHTS
jgi:hypothetical protein